MANLQWTIGDVTITRVEESLVTVSAEYLIPGITAEQLDHTVDWIRPYVTEEGELHLSMHSFVVRSAGTTIVVDTCAGTDPPRIIPGDEGFPDRLDASIDGGLPAVDVVLCTHLHFDHVGWNTTLRDGERIATFPNARYLFARVELEHTTVDDDMDVMEPAVRPLLDADLVDLVELDHRITDEVRLIPTTGHTPGHVSVVIESGDDVAMITGDAFHSPIQIAFPELAASNVDWDSAASTATRRSLVERCADDGRLVLGTHFAPPTGGRIHTDDDGTTRFGVDR